MKILLTFKIKLTTALLALALCATDAAAMEERPRKRYKQSASSSAAMNPAAPAAATSMAASSSSSTTAHDEIKTIAPLTGSRREQLKKLLYDELDPMPPELIAIIVKYEHYELKGEPKRILTDHKNAVNCLTQLANDHIASGAEDNTIKIWDPETGACVKTLTGHNGPVNCLIKLNDDYIASGSDDGTIKIWNLNAANEKKACVATLNGHESWINHLIKLSNGYIASGSCDCTIKIWNPKTGKCVKTISNTGEVRSLIQLTNNQLAFKSNKNDDTIEIWDIKTDKCIKTLTGPKRNPSDSYIGFLIQLSDERIASGNCDGTIMIWDLKTGALDKTIHGHTGDIQRLILLANDCFASCSWDGTVKIWNTKTGAFVKSLPNHVCYGAPAYAWSLIQLSDSRLVFGSLDTAYNEENKPIRIWDPNADDEKSCIKTLTGHTNDVSYLIQLANGYLVSASFDGTIIIWK